MIPPFDEALADLLAQYTHHDPDDLIAVMLRAVDGLKDQIKESGHSPGLHPIGDSRPPAR